MNRLKRQHACRALVVLAVCTLGALSCGDPVGPRSGSTLGRRLIAGERVACALNGVGSVYCWGLNSNFWEYAAPPEAIPGRGAPTQMPSVFLLTKFALGVGTHFCGIDGDNRAICWARGDAGQLGGGAVANSGNGAVAVAGEIRWADISVSRLTTCGLAQTGEGYCWGLNQQGALGSAATEIGARVAVPTLVDGGRTFSSIAAGWLHGCGITTDGDAWCWGSNTVGQLGIGAADTVVRRSPVPVAGGLKFTQLSLGSRYSCGLTTQGDAYCWGANATGQLGDGTTEARSAPTLVAGGLTYVQLVASSGFATGAFAPPPAFQGGYGHTCALTSARHPYCWGWNGNGEVGDGTMIDKHVPTAVARNLTLETIAVGGAYSCGMYGDDVWCWGSNINGQIGKGDELLPAREPQPVLPPFGPPAQ
ncbi:MAG: hypothetical protein O2973_10550 [Gemmatimonadetes bacterium]|nr:hypothetical protein [Gemmatimonadota bacterium]